MSDEMNKVKKPLLYVDLDNVMVDFKEAITRLSPAELEKYKDHYDDIPHFFYTMKPMKVPLKHSRHCPEGSTFIFYRLPLGTIQHRGWTKSAG